MADTVQEALMHVTPTLLCSKVGLYVQKGGLQIDGMILIEIKGDL